MDNSHFVAIAFLILGWLLGLLQPAIAEAIRRRRESNEVIPALRVELDELRYRIALAAYFLQMRFGNVDRKCLEWVLAQIRAYQGDNPKDHLLKSVEGQLALSDEAIALLVARHKAQPEAGVSVKKYAAPLIDSRIPLFWQLPPRLQRALLGVRANLDLYNEEVARAQHYFDLTFGPVSDINHERAVTNLNGCYANLIDRAQVLVSRIETALIESQK